MRTQNPFSQTNSIEKTKKKKRISQSHPSSQFQRRPTKPPAWHSKTKKKNKPNPSEQQRTPLFGCKENGGETKENDTF